MIALAEPYLLGPLKLDSLRKVSCEERKVLPCIGWLLILFHKLVHAQLSGSTGNIFLGDIWIQFRDIILLSSLLHIISTEGS